MKQLLRILVLVTPFLGLCHGLAGQEPKVGTVEGFVLDAVTGERIRQARVEVETQSYLQTVTNLDGKYVLKLPPGTYKLRFSAENYHDSVLSDILVTAGGTLEASTVMSNKSMMTTVDVNEKVGAVATAEAMLNERKLAPGVS